MARSVQMVLVSLALILILAPCYTSAHSMKNRVDPHQPLSRINLHRQLTALNSAVSISVPNDTLGINGESFAWVTVTFSKTVGAAASDWIGVFSPANFNGSQCLGDLNLTNQVDQAPYICSAPIKYLWANKSANYVKSGSGSYKFRLINQRQDYAFGFFSGGLDKPVLEGLSKAIRFQNPNAPLWPRLALGQEWDEMTVTWTSGYSQVDARPVVAYKWEEDKNWTTVLAITRTYKKSDMCGPPASTIGWRDPGYHHTAFLEGLWPSSMYSYKVGHKLKSTGAYVWGEVNTFKSNPGVGEDSKQSVVIFGDMGKHERDGSAEYTDTQPGALNTTDTLVKDLANIDLVFHNGDIVYANGYIAQWDQYVEQVSNITKQVPYMLSSGNHERDWPGTSSFYQNKDSGGECGGPTETTYYMPTKNKDKFWYEVNYGMFHFCVGDSEEDWRKGSEQWLWLDKCLGAADRRSQPWSIFMAHRVLGYSSADEYQVLGTFGEPMGRDNLQELWQKHKVDVAFYGHVHNYERTCPVYEEPEGHTLPPIHEVLERTRLESKLHGEKSNCVPLTSSFTNAYAGHFNATINIVAGGAGREIAGYGATNTTWSIFKDMNYGYTKLIAIDHQHLSFEYRHSSDNALVDSFTITRAYHDVLGCDTSSSPECMPTTTADLG